MAKKTQAVSEGQDDFEAFIDEARGLGKVAVFRLDAVLTLQNVDDGAAALRAIEPARLKRELPGLDLRLIDRAGRLARALAYAARRADQASGQSLLPLIAEATALRSKLLAAATSFAAQGLVPQGKVDEIRRGKGSIDAAQDCVDLAALSKKYAAALKGKSPVPASDVTRAAAVGAQLLGLLRPKGSRRVKRSKEEIDAASDRDRLGALLVASYDPLRRAGGWLFGPDSDAVPALGSRRSGRKAKQPQPAPAPAAQPTNGAATVQA